MPQETTVTEQQAIKKEPSPAIMSVQNAEQEKPSTQSVLRLRGGLG